MGRDKSLTMTMKQNQLHLIKTVFTHKQTTHFSILVTDDAVCKIRYNTCVKDLFHTGVK